MKISIVIPTLNEEKYLPKLLNSIKQQSFHDYEVIVADAGSRDNTKKIAKKYNVKVVKGGLPGVGRNNGARASRGELILFLDADVILPNGFIRKAYDEMKQRKLELATCEFKPLSNLLIDKILHDFTNIFIKINQFTTPHAPGFCIFVSKNIFNKVKGFDESIKIAEDHDFVKRASKFTPFRVLSSPYIKVSVRRLGKEGRFILAKKYLQVELYRIFKGELRDDFIKYTFGDFTGKEDKYQRKKLNIIKKQLDYININYSSFIRKYLNNKKTQPSYIEYSNKIKKEFNKTKALFEYLIIRKK